MYLKSKKRKTKKKRIRWWLLPRLGFNRNNIKGIGQIGSMFFLCPKK